MVPWSQNIQSSPRILRLNHIQSGPIKQWGLFNGPVSRCWDQTIYGLVPLNNGDCFTVWSQKSETRPKFFSPVQSRLKITVWSGQSTWRSRLGGDMEERLLEDTHTGT